MARAHVLDELAVTEPDAARSTLAVHRAAFAAAGVADAFERVIGIVVQPGVEFGNANVAIYRPERARAPERGAGRLPGLVFEAHSTDYQPAAALAALVEDGFAILKVGPGLTFALREALYGLDAIATELEGAPAGRIARAGDGAADAGQPGTLEIALSRHAGRAAGCSAISATATASATTGPTRGLPPRSIACSTGSASATFPRP